MFAGLGRGPFASRRHTERGAPLVGSCNDNWSAEADLRPLVRIRRQCVGLPAAQPLRMLNDRFRCWPRTAPDPLPPLSLQEAVIQRLNPPNPCGFICTVGWSGGLDIALTFLDLQKAIAHIVR